MYAIQCVSNSGGVMKTEFWAYTDQCMSILSFQPKKGVRYTRVVVPERGSKKINSNKVYQWFLQERYRTESLHRFIHSIHPY